jgi:thioredoxin 1
MDCYLEEISKENFSQKIKSEENSIVLVDFYATWCGPCRIIAPQLENLAKELKGVVTIYKFNIDSDADIPSKYEVTAVPTLIFFFNGKEEAREVGLCNIQTIKDRILKIQKQNKNG